MINMKSLLSMSTATIALLVLGGCLTSDDKDGDSSTVSVSTTIQVLDIEPPVGSAPGTITTHEVYTYCDEGDLVTENDTTSSNYLISGGNLFLWDEGDCLMTKLSGSSSTIIGTWNGTSLNATDSVPAAFRPTVCYDDIDEDDAELFDDFSVQYKISSTQINGKMSAKVCYARAFSSLIEDDEDSTEAYQVLTEGCSTVKIKNVAENKTATITSSFKGDSATIKFSYDGAVCTGSVYLGLSNNSPTTCSDDEDDEGGDSFQALFGCMVGSGFFGDIEMEKRQSLTKAMSKALKPGVGGPF